MPHFCVIILLLMLLSVITAAMWAAEGTFSSFDLKTKLYVLKMLTGLKVSGNRGGKTQIVGNT